MVVFGYAALSKGQKTSHQLRTGGYPCIVKNKSGASFNFILPVEAQRLLEANNFIVLLNTNLKNKFAHVIVAKKPENIKPV